MINQSELKAEFLKIDDFNRHNFYPGGLPEAEKIVAGLSKLIPNNSISFYLQLYTTTAVHISMSRKGLYSVDRIPLEKRLTINLEVHFGDLIPEDVRDTVITYCMRVFDNYDFISALRDQNLRNQQLDLKKQYAERISANASKKNDAINKSEYGLSCENPVYANMIEGSYSYLCKLWANDDTPLVWERTGSVGAQSSPDRIDKYVLFTPDGSEYGNIFVNMYSDLLPSYVPIGYYSPELNMLPSARSSTSYDCLPTWQKNIVDEMANKMSREEQNYLTRALEIMNETEKTDAPLTLLQSLSRVADEKDLHIPTATACEQLNYLSQLAKYRGETINEMIDGLRSTELLEKYLSEGCPKSTIEVDFTIWRDRIKRSHHQTRHHNYVCLMGWIPEPPFFPRPNSNYNKRFILEFGESIYSGTENSIMCFYKGKLAGSINDAFINQDFLIVEGYLANIEYEDENGKTINSLSLVCESFERIEQF